MLRAQPDPLEQRGDPFLALAAGADPMDDQRLADDLARRHARIERRVRVLVDHLHLPAIRQHLPRIEIGDVLAADR